MITESRAPQRFDKIDATRFQSGPCGLVWLETVESGDTEVGEYQFWCLIDSKTDRILASIEGPSSTQITFQCRIETGTARRFISLDGAKRYALAEAIQILRTETIERSGSRHARRHKV